MSALADALRLQGTGAPMWLGFPGPSGSGPAGWGSSGWNSYWSDYGSIITSKYNNIALHAYGSNLQGLENSAYGQATDVRSRFPQFPQRITEYGVAISNYGGNHAQRASDYVSFVNWVRSGWNNYIFACHAFIAAPSTSQDQYVFTDEAAALANGVGCVTQ